MSQLIRYYRDCALYSDFLNRAQLLTYNLLEVSYVASWLQSSPNKIPEIHEELVDPCEISISKMAMEDLFHFAVFLSSITDKAITERT